MVVLLFLGHQVAFVPNFEYFFVFNNLTKWLLCDSLQINQATHDQALVLQSALQNIPNPSAECMLRNVAIRLAQQISDEVGFKWFKAPLNSKPFFKIT